jgi:hypothetical protein
VAGGRVIEWLGAVHSAGNGGDAEGDTDGDGRAVISAGASITVVSERQDAYSQDARRTVAWTSVPSDKRLLLSGSAVSVGAVVFLTARRPV